MKKVIWIRWSALALLWMGTCRLWGISPEENRVPILSHLSLGMGQHYALDTYLSPLRYQGPNYRIGYELQRNGFKGDPNLFDQHLFHLSGGELTNRPGTNVEWQFDLGYQWLLQRRWRPFSAPFYLFAGGGVNLQLGGNYNLMNSNNPYNGHVLLQLRGSGGASYWGAIGKLPFGISYQLQAPLMGMGLTPDYNQPYYSFLLYQIKQENLCFTSWHNQRHFQHRLRLEIPFQSCALSLGFYHEHYAAECAGLRRQFTSWYGQVGWTIYLSRVFPYRESSKDY